MRKQYHIVPRDGRWAVTKAGGQRASSLHDTKASAIDSARNLAKGSEPSQVVVHGKDGVIQREWTYGNDPYPPRG